MLNYKGYTGQVGYDDDIRIFHGEVLDTRDVITFQGRCVEELVSITHLHKKTDTARKPPDPWKSAFNFFQNGGFDNEQKYFTA